MKYYSTNKTAPLASLAKAVTQGLAEDRGLYMPQQIKQLPQRFVDGLQEMSFQDIAFGVAEAFFGEDVEAEDLRRIVDDTLSFPCPLVEVEAGIYALELFHGPTLAFKDVGARFMARLLQYVNRSSGQTGTVNVLVATSGDTGSAVANGFLGVEGIHVFVLYPKGKVSPIQECQFTTLGRNITAIEVDGVFDDCQRLVKQAFMDNDLRRQLTLTSANSINVARFLPQAFYYFNACAQLPRQLLSQLVICVPSGNFGNLTAALFGQRMGMPVKRFIAANNANDIVFQYLKTGHYQPRPSVQTLANAMDVGDPSNFARIAEMYGSWDEVRQHISGATYSDEQIRHTMRQCYEQTGYILDPHGACGYQALKDALQPGEVGIFCETAHPAKFKQVVDEAVGISIDIPDRLAAFMKGRKQSVSMKNNYDDFRQLLVDSGK
jgi:threonine synthase